MMFSKEEFENLINNSPLFAIDRDSFSVPYRKEKYNLLALLTDYYRLYVYAGRPLETYSMELVETAVECIKYYDMSKGKFLHLFNKAMKRRMHIAKAKELIDRHRQGIVVANDDDRLIRKVIGLAEGKGLDIHEQAVQEKIAVTLGLNVEEVRRLIRTNESAQTVSSTIENDEGEQSSLFDLIPDSRPMAEEIFENESSLIDVVSKIGEVFRSVQDRQKTLLSMLLTAEIINAFCGDTERAESVLRTSPFFSSDIFEYVYAHRKIPMAKEIGKMCDLSEQSVSRAYKTFKEKIKKKLSL